tara:strand:+ start:582 stop:755 length:174 start_codon:yes stop_codon:yes gene_type:complete
MEIVTMDYETAKLVSTDFPAETESRRYLPVEIEPSKWAIGIFTDELRLIDYIRLEVQ